MEAQPAPGDGSPRSHRCGFTLFFQNGQNMTPIVLAQNMAQLSLEMKAPRVVTESDSDPSTSIVISANLNHDSTCDHGSDCDWTGMNS